MIMDENAAEMTYDLAGLAAAIGTGALAAFLKGAHRALDEADWADLTSQAVAQHKCRCD